MKSPRGIEKNVAVVGCKHTTRDLIVGLERHGYKVDYCVTIGPEKGVKQKVSGYYDLRFFLEEKGIPYILAHRYNLKSEEDRRNLLALNFDMLLVAGWQRLIPDWWLESLGIGAFGMHGASKPLPYGRGRSPMNWSLIQDKKIFFTHLFKYKPGVDDGDIVDLQLFDITPFDTCLTLHYKNLVSMIKLCTKHLPALLEGTAVFKEQPSEGASYYPKRKPSDGIIYWTDATWDIYNLVRAVTRPFPGAFTYLGEKKVFIWRAIPFDMHINWPEAKPREIVEVFYDDSFIVKTGDWSMLVLESEGYEFSEEDVGSCFWDKNTPRKVWGDLPR